LVASARNIIVTMLQTNPKGESKLLPACSLPLTGKRCIQRVLTDLGFYNIHDGAFHLVEIAPGITIEEIRAKTLGKLVVSENLKEIEV
jgi:3-oxoacid CoA-transferase subunit B